MLFCIDVGNTNIVFGIYNKDELLFSFRLETKINQTYDEYGIKILDMLEHFNVKQDDVSGIIISSVVPQIDHTLESLCNKYFNIKPIFIGPGIKTGLKIKIDNPKQLGADLLVGCVSATNKYGCPVIVIDMGTATTFAVVNEQKEMIGGLIYPGLKIAFANLFEKTSKLEEVKLEKPKQLIGKDTATCIQSGMLYGTVAMIDGLIDMMCKQIKDAKIVLTGGIGAYVYPHIKHQVYYDENLLLDGLNYIYYKNN